MENKKTKKISNTISYSEYFSKKEEILKLIGITALGIMHYYQYYTFVILSEKLKSFSIQQRNYVVLIGKILGRATLFCVLPFSTRRFLNFLTSSVVLSLSVCIFLVSFFFKGDTVNLIGISIAGRICIFQFTNSPDLCCGKLPSGSYLSIYR